MFHGSIPALVTPFGDDGAFAEGAYRDLVEWQIAEGSAALVACGTTGEAATLTFEEHFRVVRVCVDQARGARAGDRRGGIERHAGRGAEPAGIAGGGGGRGADGAALLQPPIAGGDLPPFRGARRRGTAADRALQRPRADGDRHPASDPDPHRRGVPQGVRRGQGRERGAPARVGASLGAGAGLLPALGQRRSRARLQCDGWGGLHLGDCERRPAALRRLPGGLRGRRLYDGAHHP